MSTATASRIAKGELQCQKCDHKPFPNRRGLAMHNARVHEHTIPAPHERNGAHACAKCAKSFRNEHGLHIHEATMHNRHHAKSVKGMVNLVLDSFASKNGNDTHVSLCCPVCKFDLEPLTGGTKPAVYCCPGCATPIQAMIDRLVALVKKQIRY